MDFARIKSFNSIHSKKVKLKLLFSDCQISKLKSKWCPESLKWSVYAEWILLSTTKFSCSFILFLKGLTVCPTCNFGNHSQFIALHWFILVIFNENSWRVRNSECHFTIEISNVSIFISLLGTLKLHLALQIFKELLSKITETNQSNTMNLDSEIIVYVGQTGRYFKERIKETWEILSHYPLRIC